MTALEQYLGGLSDKRVGVIGAGVSNMPLIRMLRAAGVRVTVHDKKEPTELGDGYARVTFDVRAGKRAGEKAGKRAGKQVGEQGRSAFDARSGSGENAEYGAAEAAVADGTGRDTELPLQEVALSASFDDSEVLRTVMTVAAVPAAQATGAVVAPRATEAAAGDGIRGRKAPGTVTEMTVVPRAVPAARATGGTLFAYGLLLNLMPGIFGLFLRLARQLRERAERRRIFCRYAAGAALGLALLGIGYRGAYFGALYYNPWLAAGAAAVILPLWAEALGYMEKNIQARLAGRAVYGSAGGGVSDGAESGGAERAVCGRRGNMERRGGGEFCRGCGIFERYGGKFGTGGGRRLAGAGMGGADGGAGVHMAWNYGAAAGSADSGGAAGAESCGMAAGAGAAAV